MRILIAQGSSGARQLLRQALESLGHDCLTAADATAAWQRFSEAEVDVVFAGLPLPGSDAGDLCREFRSARPARHPYFVLLAPPHDREDAVRAMAAGVDDYLDTPVDPHQLRARLIIAERVTTIRARLSSQQAELDRLATALHDDGRRDHLTGVGNRLRMEEDLDGLTDAAERYGHRFSVALFDVDRFKAFNESRGQFVGDEVLRSVATTLVGRSRRGDRVYRYGADELLVTLVEQDLGGARVAAERMRSAVRGIRLALATAPPVGSITVSAGIAQFEPADTGNLAGLLARADGALQRAKRLGGNRVVLGEAGRRDGEAAERPVGVPTPDDSPLLLVEDDVTQARMIEGMLKMSLGGRDIVHVETLSEAKRYLRESRVACILLDLMLPDSSDLEGLVDLRNTAPEAPIVVVTADSDESRAVKAVQAGAQDYLIKDRMDGTQLRRAVLYAIERQRGELRLAHGALHDALTGLPNRTLFVDRLAHELAQTERRSTSIAVLFLDLDGFKAVNDRMGHAAGDRLLRVLAGRLLSSMRPGDTVARYGGDEFTILGTDIASQEDPMGIARRVTDTVSTPLVIDGDEIELSCSIGIAMADGLGRKPDEIIREADEAMYVAKRRGEAFSFLDPDPGDAASGHLSRR